MEGRLTRIMIVDDEDVFCAHLTRMLDWKKHGFHICAEAKNGLEAMELLELHHPDIVITDIQMPNVDGLSLVKHIAEKHPHIQVITLSGYDDYNSVRGSLKHGALDYLLKHQMNSENLLDILNDANNRINNNHSVGISNSTLIEQAEIGLSELRRSVLRDLLSGEINSKDDLIKRTSRVGIDINCGHLVIMIVEINQMNNLKARYSDIEWMTIFTQINDMIDRLINDSGNQTDQMSLLLPKPENRFTILFLMPKRYSFALFHNFILTHIQGIRTALKRHYNITANFSISNTISDFMQLPNKYKQTLTNLKSNFYRGHDMVFREEIGVLDTEELSNTNLTIDDETQVFSLLRDGRIEELLRHIDMLFDRQRVAFSRPERLQMMFVELLSILIRLARKEHLDPYELFLHEDMYSQMRYMTLDEMKIFFSDACKNFVKERISQSGGSNNDLTQMASSFIRRNYREPISLKDVADAISVSPSYLSRVFKADTGKTVVEYINNSRIEAAKQMISDGFQLKELAEQIGFNSTNYFITVFRQITGKTPMQYRESHNE